MERLLSVKDIMARYQCSRQTAIRYIKQMEHMERPYTVTERAVRPPEVIRREMLRNRLRRAT